MFWKNILRVSSTCKGVLDYVWIESRIKNAANKGVCFELVTALGAVVHRPSLFGDRLTVAESSSFVGHRPYWGTPPLAWQCTAVGHPVPPSLFGREQRQRRGAPPWSPPW
jgi:hypothetical protein